MSKEPLLTPLPGHNPYGLLGIRLIGGAGSEFFVVPGRRIDILDGTVSGRPAFWRHPAGHRSHPLGALDHIEGFFTSGIENVGPPSLGLSLHGSFCWRSAVDVSHADDSVQFVSGTIICTDAVRGPYVSVRRQVSVGTERAELIVKDKITATVASDFMWLYHPNFSIKEGDRWYGNALSIVSRDEISNHSLATFHHFENVGKGYAKMPPSASEEENFETCFIINMQADPDGGITALLSNSDQTSGIVILYLGDFDSRQRFVLWKNPRGGVCGLEYGSLPFGREWAMDHKTVSIVTPEQPLTYQCHIVWLQSAKEVQDIIRQYKLGDMKPQLHRFKGSADVFYQ